MPLFLYAGPEYEPIDEYVVPASVEARANMVYKGFLTDPSVAYYASDVYVMTSDYENYPIVLFEALAAGVRSIAPDLPITKNELKGHPGLRSYRQGDCKSLAQEILAFYEIEDVDSEYISRATIEKFGYDRSGTDHVQLYRKICGKV
jgi:glycosyltransferase involved in cell wall biosynthesis